MSEIQHKTGLRLCCRCVLPETFPGITFDDYGVCNHCLRDKSSESEVASKKRIYRERLETLIEDTKGSAPTYDAIMAFSGGKDSSYTLKILRKRHNLRILAFTFDNHFVSRTHLLGADRCWRERTNILPYPSSRFGGRTVMGFFHVRFSPCEFIPPPWESLLSLRLW